VTTPHPNEQLLREAYSALARGDLPAVGEALAENFVCHVPGRGPLAGEYRGRDRVLGVLARLSEATEGTYMIVPHDVLANEDHVVVLEKHSCEFRGHRFEGQGVAVYHVRYGKVSEVWIHPEDQQGADEFVTLIAPDVRALR
jgi:ketosteroid isomerase-like protein